MPTSRSLASVPRLTFRGKPVTLRGAMRLARLVAHDMAQVIDLCVHRSEWKRSRRELGDAPSPAACYQLARTGFGIGQVEEEILAFLEYARDQGVRVVCEIGTFAGGTTFLFTRALPSTSLLIGVDLHVQNRARLRFMARFDQELHFLNGSSSSASVVAEVQGLLRGRKLDLLFIDGDHRYDGVRSDFLAYRHLVKDGGIVAFHDIVPDSESRGGPKTPWWSGDVPRFWSAIKALYQYREFVNDPDQHGFGIGAITYDPATDVSSV